MSEDELKKYHNFKIKTSDGIELDLIETKYYEELLDLYQQEKEKNKELTDFIEAIEELKQAKKPITDLVYEMNKFDDEFISKDKIKPFIKAIESWADYIQEDEGCYYKGLNKLAQKLNDTLDGKITPNEKELCVEYELLE